MRLKRALRIALLALIACGASHAMAQAWPEANHGALIIAAITKIRESDTLDPDTVRGFCFEATRDLYRRMVEVGDFPGALRAIRQLRDLAH